jgi:cobalt-zinc-cadmium efflux system membrane fusion protein
MNCPPRLQASILLAFALVTVCSCSQKPETAIPDSRLETGKTRESQVSADGTVTLPAGSPQLQRLRVQAVESANLPLDEVVAPGKIESNPSRISRVVMPVPGRVLQVMVALGDAVKEGQTVLAIQSPEASAATSGYRQARARLAEAQATLSKAEADLARVKDLYAGRAIAQKEVVSAEAALAQAKSALEQAQASLDESQRKLEILGIAPGESNPTIPVRAPLSGKILDLSVAAGEYRNDTSAPLMTIADLSTVFMAADIPESQIRLVSVGETVKITLNAYPEETFAGTVARIADVVDPQTRTIKVRVGLANRSGRLRPDMFGEIRHEETFRKVPVVPASAIVQSDKRSLVWREKSPGSYEPVTVTFGKQDGDRVPVLTGIREGDRIVVDGGMLLRGVQ